MSPPQGTLLPAPGAAQRPAAQPAGRSENASQRAPRGGRHHEYLHAAMMPKAATQDPASEPPPLLCQWQDEAVVLRGLQEQSPGSEPASPVQRRRSERTRCCAHPVFVRPRCWTWSSRREDCLRKGEGTACRFSARESRQIVKPGETAPDAKPLGVCAGVVHKGGCASNRGTAAPLA